MTSVSQEEVTRLIGRFYDAALDERLWPDVIQDFLRAVNFDKAAFGILDSRTERALDFQILNCAPEVGAEFLEYYHLLDPKLPQFLRKPSLRTLYDYQVITEREMDRHEYFDWLKRTCDARYHLARCIRSVPEFIVTLGMARRDKLGHVQGGEIEFFEFLCSHFERAVQISFRLGQTRAMANASAQMLDQHPLGIVLVDRHGQILLANSAARALAEDPQGIRLSRDGIKLALRGEQQRLQELITCAIATSVGMGLSSGGVLPVPRGHGRQPLSLTVAPLNGANGLFDIGRPCAIVLIADPEKSQPLPEDHLRRLYGLTRAEARLAVLLATGMDLQQAAERLCISRNTARSQLARIFDKTRTSRQAELVRILMQSAPAISPGPLESGNAISG